MGNDHGRCATTSVTYSHALEIQNLYRQKRVCWYNFLMNLLLCPLKKELSSVLAIVKRQKILIRESKISSHNLWHVPEVDLICAIGGHGKVQFGIHAQFLISHFHHQKQNISSLLCLGAGLVK